VLTADRAVSAFDGQTGRKLWTSSAPASRWCCASRRDAGRGRHAGGGPVGPHGRPRTRSTAASRWEAPIATPRGINDVERLVDLVGSVSRSATGCARALPGQRRLRRRRRGESSGTKPATVSKACMATTAWSSAPNRRQGSGWRRDNGERAGHRSCCTAAHGAAGAGRSVVVGDSTAGAFLSREDGSPEPAAADGSAIAAAPVWRQHAGGVTRNGGVTASCRNKPRFVKPSWPWWAAQRRQVDAVQPAHRSRVTRSSRLRWPARATVTTATRSRASSSSS
jgi:hypothetical protein